MFLLDEALVKRLFSVTQIYAKYPLETNCEGRKIDVDSVEWSICMEHQHQTWQMPVVTTNAVVSAI